MKNSSLCGALSSLTYMEKFKPFIDKSHLTGREKQSPQPYHETILFNSAIQKVLLHFLPCRSHISSLLANSYTLSLVTVTFRHCSRTLTHSENFYIKGSPVNIGHIEHQIIKDLLETETSELSEHTQKKKKKTSMAAVKVS